MRDTCIWTLLPDGKVKASCDKAVFKPISGPLMDNRFGVVNVCAMCDGHIIFKRETEMEKRIDGVELRNQCRELTKVIEVMTHKAQELGDLQGEIDRSCNAKHDRVISELWDSGDMTNWRATVPAEQFIGILGWLHDTAMERVSKDIEKLKMMVAQL